MLIAFTAMENSLDAAIDPRFGRAAFYIIINTDTDEIVIHDNSAGINASNGAGTGAAQTLSEYGVEELYTGRVGPKAADVLNTAGIRYHENLSGTVQDVLKQIKTGSLPLPLPQTPVQQQPSPSVETTDTAVPVATCPGAISSAAGYQMAGQGRGLGRGMGAGRGAGRGQGAGRGRGACRR